MRGIAIPVDLDSQVNLMFEKSHNVMIKAKHWFNSRLNKRESVASISRDYRNIIEGLQVWILLLNVLIVFVTFVKLRVFEQ